MIKIKGDIILNHKDGTTNKFYIYEPFSIETDEFILEVQRGFPTDGASVPRFFWCIFPPIAGRYMEGAVVHDVLYRTQVVSKHKADKIFLEVMKKYKTPKIQAYPIFWAVWVFGWVSWFFNKKDVEKYKKLINFKKKDKIQSSNIKE